MTTSFDFVIVGAGSAGCALARRLSDDPAITVALLEAGGPDTRTEITTPTEYFKLWGTDVDWNYQSVAQAGTKHRVHGMPRGKVLGGTSSINGMVYLRGARGDFDDWESRGCDGWGWNDVERAYIEMEATLQPDFVGDRNPLSEVFLAAAEQAGLAHNPSFDSGDLAGSGWNRSTIRAGRRNNSFQAFVASVAERANLTVVSETIAHRLLVDDRGNVTGVEVAPTSGGASSRIAAGEVVLCAGAFDSPRLLMLSGIGPASHLRSVGIDPVVDLPVGQNLIDHLLIGVVYDSRRPISLAHSMVTEACAFGWSSCPRSEVPDVEISFAKEANFAPPTDDGRHRYTIIPGITQPRSRGSVQLRSANWADPALIDPGYLTHPEDLTMLIDGIRLARKIGAAEAFSEWNDGEFFPGPHVESDEAIANYIGESVSTWFHPVGTCRMGVGDDAVVSPTLAVHGTRGLRVADASVMPEIVSVNTNAASMMIGWYAADRIV